MKLPNFMRKKWIRAGLFCLLAFALAILGSDVYISMATSDQVYTNLSDVPEAPVAVVLGTAKYVGEWDNSFYKPRIKAAYELFAAGKVRGIIVSGDNSRKNYNEPMDMKNDLVAMGVPARYITLDYAGFRTLDSVVRAKEVFGCSKVIFVSQEFHCRRALFIANSNALEATAYPAADVTTGGHTKIRAREIVARFMAVIDVVFGKSPKFLGKQEHVTMKDV
ncbi:MAG: YdcF family protein [Phycisphaerae bacterium]|nr:YdcF family protein [Phycisphaerae bacterium]